MRGQFLDQGRMFSYVSPAERVPAGHPLRAVRAMVWVVLAELHGDFAKLYSSDGRPLDTAGTTAERAVVADILRYPLGAPVDGATGLQLIMNERRY